jgi:hypothetical protein
MLVPIGSNDKVCTGDSYTIVYNNGTSISKQIPGYSWWVDKTYAEILSEFGHKIDSLVIYREAESLIDGF